MRWAIATPLPLAWIFGFVPSGQGQNIIPSNDGTGTQVQVNGQTHTITGGTTAGSNLFHSFNQFNLDANQVADFLSQPDIANILGRINGGDPSVINGLIQVSDSNANLLLMNPAGILFGPDAQLNLPADFTATTATGIGFGHGLNHNNWFSATGPNDYTTLVGNPNQFVFDAGMINGGSQGAFQWGSVANLGDLTVNSGHTLSLIGGTVLNTGQLSAPEGQVTLMAVPQGDRVHLSQAGMILQLDVQPLGSLSTHPLTASTFSPLSLPELLTISGFGHATDLTIDPNGNALLTGSGLEIDGASGTTVVTGQIGAASGTIDILGQQVGLFGATIEASGSELGPNSNHRNNSHNGGQIRIGGEFQGQDSLPQAWVTVVDGESTIVANGVGTGDGGRIIVWAEDTAKVHGSLSATGGLWSGDGGLIETSGKRNLDVNGITVDAGADHGQSGLWLLDPSNINIANTGTGTLTSGVFDPGTSDTIAPNTITLALNAGTNVTLTTSSGTGGSGDITLSDSIDQLGGGNASLTLTGRRFINNTGSAISMTSTGELIFNINAVNPGTATAAELGKSIQDAHDSIGTIGGTSTINLAAGTYQRGSELSFSKPRLSLVGAGQGVTILDGGGTNRVAQITNTGNVTLSHLTVQNGSAAGVGGGLYNNQGTLSLQNVTVENNRTTSGNDGGGIRNNNGTLTISASIIKNNTAAGRGGAIRNSSGTVTISNGSVLDNNRAGVGGGGIFSNPGTLTISNSTISNNIANGIAGGLWMGGTLTITNSMFSNNQTNRVGGSGGGGIFHNTGSSMITDSLFSGNRALGSNGGGLATNSASATITNTTFSGNQAQNGGGIVNQRATLTLNNTTLSGNTATLNGGGLYHAVNNTGTVSLNSSLISGNTATNNGGGIFNNGGGILNLTDTAVVNNTAGANGGGLHNLAIANLNRTTLANNSATDEGGGINNDNGTLNVTNSTLSGNSATNGGGIENDDMAILTHVTLFQNTATGTGGGIRNNSTLNLANSIIANSTNGDLVDTGTTTASGVNLVEDGSGAAFSALSGDPLLATLGDYGGPDVGNPNTGTMPLQTHLLLPGSSAINGGANAQAAGATDQRGVNRIMDGTVDLGAAESAGFILSSVVGNNQSTTVNTTFANPFSVQLLEAGFNQALAFSGLAVTFTAPSTGPSGTFSGGASETISTDSSGLATSSILTANTVAGGHTLTTTAPGTTGGNFTLTNNPDAPTNLAITGGNNQSTTVNTPFTNALTVQITDQFGNGVPSATVTFTPPPTGASGTSSATATTNSTGLATVGFTANTIAGSYNVDASSSSLNGRFNLTNTPDVAANLTIVAGNDQATTAGSTFANPLTIAVTDQFGNPVPNAVIDFTTPDAGASVLLTTDPVITDASGMVTLNIMANDQAGSFILMAATDNVVPVDFNLTNTSNDIPIDLVDLTVEEPTTEGGETVTAQVDNPVTLSSSLTQQVAVAYEETESANTGIFTAYLGTDQVEAASLPNIQNALRQANLQTGTTTAHVTFKIKGFGQATGQTPTVPEFGEQTDDLALGGQGAKPLEQLGEYHPELKSVTKFNGPQPELFFPASESTQSSPSPANLQAQADLDEMEVLIVTADGEPILKRWPVNQARLLRIADLLRQEISDPQNRSQNYKRVSQLLYQQLLTPIRPDLQERGVTTLLLSMDQGLRSVPIAALHDGNQFLIEQYQVGTTPSMSLTNTDYVNLRQRSALLMGASEFANQSPLPAVEQELKTITETWNQATTQQDQPFFLNDAFNLENLQAQRQQLAPGIIHLATHADFLPGDVSNSYIQLWGERRLTIDQMPNLGWFTAPSVELLVLSACRTAVGSPEAELGFAGLAVQAGVRSALASLWYVSDEGTLALMSEFYHHLGQQEVTVKAAALQQAQLAMLRGEVSLAGGQLQFSGAGADRGVELPSEVVGSGVDLSHPYYWAAFTMIGSPW
jgi:filamentous hemagglutinin family protein